MKEDSVMMHLPSKKLDSLPKELEEDLKHLKVKARLKYNRDSVKKEQMKLKLVECKCGLIFLTSSCAIKSYK